MYMQPATAEASRPTVPTGVIERPATRHTNGEDPGGMQSPYEGAPSFLLRPDVPKADPAPPNHLQDERGRAARLACEEAALRVDFCLREMLAASQNLFADPRSSRLRRIQSKAASDLSAAQYTLEQSFDRVPPRS
jgi:hypothetical protein